jgi:DNA-binding beta-propeller fold protein YncE
MRLTCLLPLSLMAACSAESSLFDEAMDTGRYDDAAGAMTGSWGDDDDDASVPETEDDFLALPPAQTDTYVFVANPGRNTVTRINVQTLEVRTTEVGANPITVLTTPDYATAAVFNSGDDTVHIIDADTLDTRIVGVRANFNAMKMSPDGLFVVLWHDVAAEDPDEPPPEGLQSFNETSFVNLQSGEHFAMAVGFNPRNVVFDRNSQQAAVVSDEYLALVDLQSEALLPTLIQLDADLIDTPEAEEVVLSPDGDYAFVRQFGTQEILVVDLLSETVGSVPVGLNPTDLDLSPDGSQAVVVTRGSDELWVLETADPFAPPEVVSLPLGTSFGSVLFEPTGTQALVYTTAGSVDRYATWNLLNDEITLRSLVKPIKSLSITPTGESALIFHTLDDAADADTNSPFYGEWALTMLALTDYRTNPLLLPAEPTGFANSSNGNYGFFIMEDQPFLEQLNFETLLHEEISLKSNPVYVGVLPDLDEGDGVEPHAWASQDHELGRISFLDPLSQAVETITGFELNSQIGD